MNEQEQFEFTRLQLQASDAHEELDLLGAPRTVSDETLTIAGRLAWVRENYTRNE